MRIAACIVVAVLGSSPEALAQPPAHAKANGHARRSDFAANDFKVGLRAAAPDAKKDLPLVQLETPRTGVPSTPPPRAPIPDCIQR